MIEFGTAHPERFTRAKTTIGAQSRDLRYLSIRPPRKSSLHVCCCNLVLMYTMAVATTVLIHLHANDVLIAENCVHSSSGKPTTL